MAWNGRLRALDAFGARPERGSDVKRRVSPIAATLAILAAVVIAAFVWVHGLAPKPSRTDRGPGINLKIKVKDIDAARKNAKQARDKVLKDIKNSSSRQDTE